MNYIKNLEGSNQEQNKRIDLALEKLHDFRAHLQLPKFQGVDHNGERLDWISTNDVDSVIIEIMNALACPIDWRINEKQEITFDMEYSKTPETTSNQGYWDGTDNYRY